MERILDSFYERVRSPSCPLEANDETKFMKAICDIYGLRHAAYITVDRRSLSSRNPKYLVTYPVEWQEEYRRSLAGTNNPVIQAGLTELLPFDWKAIRQRYPASDSLFGLARDFGVGHQGLTVPIRGEESTRALFSVTGDFSDKEWKDFTKKYRKDFIIIGNYFHKKIFGNTNEEISNITDREKQVLQLCGLGKTAIEISNDLEISVTTVKYFLNQIRYKLNTINTTQSVAVAIKSGIII